MRRAPLGALGGGARRGGVDVRAGLGGGRPQRHQLDLALGVAEAVGLLVGGVEGLAQVVRVGLLAGVHRQLERLAAVAQLGGDADRGVGRAELVARALRQRARLLAQRARR